MVAVQAWAKRQRTARPDIELPDSGETAFEVEDLRRESIGLSPFQIAEMEKQCPFPAEGRMHLLMNDDDVSLLFVHGGVCSFLSCRRSQTTNPPT